MPDNGRPDEWTTMQAALAFGGFIDAAETERVTLWAAEEIKRLREALSSAHQTIEWLAEQNDRFRAELGLPTEHDNAR